MRSRWIRQKQILEVPTRHPWWVSHAQLPTPLLINDRLLRIFVAGRDANNRGSIVSIDVDPGAEMAVLKVSQGRLMEHGLPGAFDCDGLGVTSATAQDGRHVFVSAGMNAQSNARYEIGIGLVESTDHGDTFSRVSGGALFKAGAENPAGCSSGQAMLIDGVWHLWFVSWRDWCDVAGQEPEPRYDIRHAVSRDGLAWDQDADTSLGLMDETEGGLARPWVQRTDDGFEMWYSIRGRFDVNDPAARQYKMGYATSIDGQNWVRRDAEHSFDPPVCDGDWDQDMQCYASVMSIGKQTYMFYCGNDYGRFGFGYAIRADG